MPIVNLTDKDQITEFAEAVRFERYPDWSIDELLLRPMEARRLCVEVRLRMGAKSACPGDTLILRSLLSARKRSRTRKTGRDSKPRQRRRS
jgi:hypothetical protein